MLFWNVFPSSPGPGHGTLHGVALWEVVPGEAEHLQPVGAVVTPLVFGLAGDVQVARRLGTVAQGRFLWWGRGESRRKLI